MDWQELGRFTLTKDWQYTRQIKSRDFKIVYLKSTLRAVDSTGMAALVDVPNNIALDSTEVFKAQRISAYSIAEIIRFPEPPRDWLYRLAVKQLITPKNSLPTCEIQIYMPAYSSAPVFNGSTNAVAASIVATDNTKSVILSVSNPNKIGTTIINNSAKGKLYVSVGIAASLTVYDKILNYLEVYESPFNWSGDIFGIWDKADAQGNARIKDFS